MSIVRFSTAASLVLATIFVAGQAQAISRYDSTKLSCSRAQSIVANEGAAIMRYPSSRNPSLILYDRFVAHRGYCRFNEYAATKWIPTADRNKCPLYYCRQGNYHYD